MPSFYPSTTLGPGGAQAYDATLTAWAGTGAQGLPYYSAADTVATLALAADKGIYATGAGALATFDLSSFARTFLDDANGPAVCTTIGAQASDAQLTALAGTTPTAGGITVWSSETACANLSIGAANTIFVSNGTTPSWLPPSATLPGVRVADELYGSGRDGNVVADGAATITIDAVSVAPAGGIYDLAGRDINADTLTLSDTVVLVMGGGLVRCRTLVGPASGTAYIRDTGDSGSGSGAGITFGATGSTDRSNGGGGAGRGTGGAGTASSAITGSIGARGGTGGTGAGGNPAGGASGTATRSASDGTPYAGTGLTMLTPPSPVGAGYKGGSGGGGGAHEGTSGVSGGGGAGGGILGVFAQTLGANAANITVQANGGNGGNATGTDNGGGGGGGGGFAALIYDYGTSIPTVQANGGTGGTASGAGANGNNGSNGTTSTRKMTV